MTLHSATVNIRKDTALTEKAEVGGRGDAVNTQHSYGL